MHLRSLPIIHNPISDHLRSCVYVARFLLAFTVFTAVGSLPTFLSQSKSIAWLKAEACRAKRALAKAQLSSPSSATIQAQLGVV